MALERNAISVAWAEWTDNRAIGFVDEVLRGLGQVMLQNNPLTGLLFLVGLFVGGWRSGVYALLATAASTFAAHGFGVSPDQLRAGFYGYNGALVGVGLAFYLDNDPFLPIFVVAAAIVVTVVMAAISTIVDTWRVPALTSPFVVTTAISLLAVYGFSLLTPSAQSLPPALPSAAAASEMVTWETIWRGFLNGPAEVFFQQGSAVGVIFLLALAINSRVSCLMAMIGSAVGVAVAGVMGAPAGSIEAGLQGFNPALTMIALGGVFFVFERASVIYALIAACATVATTAGVAAIVAPVGSHTFTAPFVLTTWVFLFAKPVFARLHPVLPAQATTPEGNLQAFRAARRSRKGGASG